MKNEIYAKMQAPSLMIVLMVPGSCRKDDCKLFIGCQVKQCSRDKKVDFCFQCSEFPCEKTGFDANLQKRWLAINKRMKEVGVEKYFEEIMDSSRY